MTLPHVLSRSAHVTINLESYRAEQLKQAARFWIGKEAYTMRKAECLEALTRVFNGQEAATTVLAALPETQQQVLAVFARYGPKVSGALLAAELQARGLLPKKDTESQQRLAYHRETSVVDELRGKLVLVGHSDSYSYNWSYDRRYPELTLHPALATKVPPAAPVPWPSPAPSPTVQSSGQRSAAAVALDLWQVASGLQELGTWQTVKGGSLSKGSRNRLRKLAPLLDAEADPLALPDPESFYYELLRGMGYLSPAAAPSQLLLQPFDRHVQQPAVAQAWQWVRAWMDMPLWQDGIGVVPDRDHAYESVRLDPTSLRKARELLIWALCRVAHGPEVWLDVETFVGDLWQSMRHDEFSFYWGYYTWMPHFDMARKKESFPAGEQRSLAFWLDGAGGWVANALIVTLVALGLVERGQSADAPSRPCFRLTALGQAVFGAPERAVESADQPQAFLTVQPNLDILAYLDQATARQMCTLARFAKRTSLTDSQVQTFTLQRPVVYAALEAGLTLTDLESFLRSYSKTGLPDNVIRTLAEWAGKRDSLVLRTEVTLACGAGLTLGKQGRALQDGIVLLPAMSRAQAVKNYAGWSLLDHQGELSRPWTAQELGGIRTKKQSDSVAHMRLSYLAEHAPDGWQVSAASMARARQYGFTTEQMIAWLHAHLSQPLPPILAMAMHNWTGRASVFAGPVQLLHVPRASAREAILQSPLFASLLVGHIPPEWFVVRDDQAAKVTRLLTQLGFTISEVCPVPTLAL